MIRHHERTASADVDRHDGVPHLAPVDDGLAVLFIFDRQPSLDEVRESARRERIRCGLGEMEFIAHEGDQRLPFVGHLPREVDVEHRLEVVAERLPVRGFVPG